MVTVNRIQLQGRITEAGKLEVELPDDLPPGDVQVTIEVPTSEELPWEERPWTDEEIEAMSHIEPKTGAEIVAAGHVGGWEDYGITDTVEWIEEQRRKRQANSQW